MTSAPQNALSLHARLAYGSPALALAMVGIPVLMYLPRFYTDTVGVGMSIFGSIFLGARIFDAVTDPAVGFFSDRTRTRWGRRRPYILGGALPLALSVFWLYTPPQSLSPTWAAAWFGVFIIAMFLFWTVVTVPYKSLGPELTPNYDERTAIFAVRETMLVVGTLAAAVLPQLLANSLYGDTPMMPPVEGLERTRFTLYALITGAVIIATAAWCVWAVREQSSLLPSKPSSPALPPPMRSTILEASTASEGDLAVVVRGPSSVIHNRPFMILLISYTITAIGSNLPIALIDYFVTYVLKGGDIAHVVGIYFGVGVVCLPLWVKIAKKIGKKAAWLWATGFNAGFFGGVFFLGEGQVNAYMTLVGFAGIGGVAVLVLPSSMQADVVDYDQLLTGQRREGAFVGLWCICEKMAAALGVGVSMLILDAAGYIPNGDQSPQALLTLRILYVLVPVACYLLGGAIALMYPITHRAHDEILEGITARMKGEKVTDPLRPNVVLTS
jgi:glycoside/pentoside/hexuronide:cation symporter, GPH family